MFDVVLLISSHQCADADYSELRYCLRSMEENVPDLGRVFIVGVNPPPWLRLDRRVVLVPVEDRQVWKDLNLMVKVRAAISAGMLDDFVFWSDDQYALQRCEQYEFRPRTVRDLTTLDFGPLVSDRAHSKWYRRLRNTRDALLSRGRTAYDFDSHCPVLMNGRRFVEVCEDYGVDEPEICGPDGYTINTLYFNATGAMTHFRDWDVLRDVGEVPREDRDEVFWNPNQPQEWLRASAWLGRRFPRPSSFEVDGV